MVNFEKMTPLITSLQKKSKKNNQENMNRRHKILNFVRRFKKAIHENFFLKSVTIWNSLKEDQINYKKNLPNRKSEKELKKHSFII